MCQQDDMHSVLCYTIDGLNMSNRIFSKAKKMVVRATIFRDFLTQVLPGLPVKIIKDVHMI